MQPVKRRVQIAAHLLHALCQALHSCPAAAAGLLDVLNEAMTETPRFRVARRFTPSLDTLAVVDDFCSKVHGIASQQGEQLSTGPYAVFWPTCASAKPSLLQGHTLHGA